MSKEEKIYLHQGGAYGEIIVEHEGKEYYTCVYALMSFCLEEVDEIYDIQYSSNAHWIEQGAWYCVDDPEEKADAKMYKTFEELARKKYFPNANENLNFLNKQNE